MSKDTQGIRAQVWEKEPTSPEEWSGGRLIRYLNRYHAQHGGMIASMVFEEVARRLGACAHANAEPHTNPCPDCGATLYWPGGHSE